MKITRIAPKKHLGQISSFCGYGGIENPELYLKSLTGDSYNRISDITIPGLPDFRQDFFEAHVNNCVLVSITRVLIFARNHGFEQIPDNPFIVYERVREIAMKHGYHPTKAGFVRDLFVYTPWAVDNIMKESFFAFGYSHFKGKSYYFLKKRQMLLQLDKGLPILLNIAWGDYTSHTVTVAGYTLFVDPAGTERLMLKICDGWSQDIRYIDWKGLSKVFHSVTDTGISW